MYIYMCVCARARKFVRVYFTRGIEIKIFLLDEEKFLLPSRGKKSFEEPKPV